MKSSFLSFFILIFFYSLAAQEIKMFPEGAIYGYVSCFGPPGLKGSGCHGEIQAVLQIHDTLINNKVYQKSSFGISRYENKKFYIYNEDPKQNYFPDNEYILYDFSLQVNDTFQLANLYATENKLVVVSKRQRLMQNGEYRTELKLNGERWQYCWIEGIGDIFNGLFYIYQIGRYDIYSGIACFSDKYGVVYKQEGLDYPCENLNNYYVSWEGLQNLKTDIIRISPNPFISTISLALDIPSSISDVSFNLSSSDGLLVKKIPISGKGKLSITIDVSNLPKAVYFGIILFGNEIKSFSKLIKE